MRARATILALAAVALAAPACGFQEQPSFTGVREGDGVSAWADQGALAVCLANDRVGPPAAGPGGFCVDINAPAEDICRADADCGSREQCVCGRCTVATCSSNTECPAGTACNFQEKRCAAECNSDAECRGRAEFCSGGFCKGRCGMNDDCQESEFCSAMGRCIVDECQDDAGCPAGKYCRLQRQPRAMTEPSVLAGAAAHGGGAGDERFVMWLEMSNAAGTQRAIYRAVSDDGLHYQLDPADPVLQDGGDAHAPSAVAVNGGVDLYYETAAGIRHASSPDGVDFGAPATVIPGDFHAPAAARAPDGSVVVVVAEGARAGLALWTGAGAPTPLLAPGDVSLPELWRDVSKLGAPHVLIDDGGPTGPLLRVWFDAFGAESGDSVQFGEIKPLPPNDSIGYASGPLAEPTALVVYPYNPVFDRVQVFLDHRAELSPSVVRAPDAEAWLLYYHGTSADGALDEGIGVATNP